MNTKHEQCDFYNFHGEVNKIYNALQLIKHITNIHMIWLYITTWYT